MKIFLLAVAITCSSSALMAQQVPLRKSDNAPALRQAQVTIPLKTGGGSKVQNEEKSTLPIKQSDAGAAKKSTSESTAVPIKKSDGASGSSTESKKTTATSAPAQDKATNNLPSSMSIKESQDAKAAQDKTASPASPAGPSKQ